MGKKTWVKVKRGLLQPKHREKIGIRIWLYLHILDKCNWEEGAVLQWRDEQEAADLEMPVATLRLQRRQLVYDGYIQVEHRGDHLMVRVTKWVNPREYSGKVYNPPPLAGTKNPESDENLALLAGESDSKSDSESDSKSDSKSVQNLAPLIMNYSQSHSSQVTESEAGSTPPSRDQTLWVQVMAGLRKGMDRAEWSTWVQSTHAHQTVKANGRLKMTVRTPNNVGRTYLEEKVRAKAQEIAAEIARCPVEIDFEVGP